MALDIVKQMPLLKWLAVCPLQFAKLLLTHKSPNRMHPDAKKQPVSFQVRLLSLMYVKGGG